jgi:hypothetical protein
MWRSQAFQLVVVAALAAGVATRHAGIAVLTVGGLLLGSAEVFFSNAAQSVLPQLVPAGLLSRANGNQQVVQTIGETFAGPPLGSWLFAVRAALPFGLDALSFAGSAALLATLPRTRETPARERAPAGQPVSAGQPAPARNPAPMRAQIAEGVRWLARHRLLRCVAILLGVANFTSQMGQATLVLLATQVLHTGTSGYGLLWTASAVGSVLGGVVNPVVTRRLGMIPSMVVSGCAFAAVYAGTGLSPDFAVAVVLMACNGLFVTMWNIVTVTLRQTIVPAELSSRTLASRLGTARIGWLPMTVCTFPGLLIPLAGPGWRVLLFAAGWMCWSFGASLCNVSLTSYQQRTCPPEILGRVSAACRWVKWGPLPLGGLIGGALASAWGVHATLWIAVTGACSSVLWLIFSPLRRLRDLPEHSLAPAPA